MSLGAPDEHLAYEAFIAKVLEARSAKKSKPNWLAFLESVGGAAIVTLLLGGGFTAWVTHLTQSAASKRAFDNEIIQLISEHRLNADREFLAGGRKAAESALQLVSSTAAAGQGLIEIDHSRFATPRESDQAARLTEQKIAIRNAYNTAAQHWAAQSDATELLLEHYFGTAASEAWSTTASHLSRYLQCAQEHQPNLEDVDQCLPTKQEIETATVLLAGTLQEGGQARWITREEVQEIREVLQE